MSTTRHKSKSLVPLCSLNGTSELHVYHNGKENIFPLREVCEDELFELRVSGKPGFVLKRDGKLYYAEITSNLNISFEPNNPHEHKCGECRKCRALPDNKGGCEKVRNHSAEDYFKHADNNDSIVIEKMSEDYIQRIWIIAKRIEKYPFIIEGYETFNMSNKYSVFNVSSCENFSRFASREAMDQKDVIRMKKSIAEFYYSDSFKY